jgi:uncharacterized protein (DUF2235 family)
MSKNIAVFIDGTDDSFTSGAKNNSNVGLLWEACVDDPRQLKFYSDGPGIGRHILASAVGTGVNVRVQRGYDWCQENYEDGDSIFLFGFSRGAFAARSVAGMIRAVGLRRKDSPATNDQAFAVYQQAKDDPAAAAAFKAANSREVNIHFIGVWDTVGSVTLPIALTLNSIPLAPFHDVEFGPDIENAFHAVSIDEQRWDFQPTYFNPALVQPGQTLEQVFFPGVHSDIGGGYADDPSLSKITLAWIANRAKEHGLLIADESVLQFDPACCFGTLHNSYGALYDFRSRFWRPIDFNARIHTAAKQRLDDANNACKPGAYAPRNIDRNNTGYEWVG